MTSPAADSLARKAATPGVRAVIAVLWRDGLPPAGRIPLLMLGMAAMVVAAGAGLARLGWTVPAVMSAQAGIHAVLMIGVFFTTVIGLERAVALGRGWAYLGPLCAAFSGVALVLGGSVAAGPVGMAGWLLLAGSVVLQGAATAAHYRQPMPHSRVMVLGAMCGAIGSGLWAMTAVVALAVPWWLAFLILTIAGERLELSRFLPTPPAARWAFAAIVGLLFGGLLVGLSRPAAGGWLMGAAWLALAAWLARFDIARRTIRSTGLTRYIAACLLSGYVWLALAGLGALGGGLRPGDAWHDATIHALALGFVFGMVLGHAPVIFPAVLRRPIAWSGAFYLPLAILQGVLLVRVAGGLAGDWAWRAWGGVGSAAALAVFVLVLLRGALHGRRQGAGPGVGHGSRPAA